MSELVVAGIAYSVDADSEAAAEDMLLELLSERAPNGTHASVLKIWVSAREIDEDRVADMRAKEEREIGE